MQCPNGHESAATDYCDTCGILMSTAGAGVAVAAGAAASGPGTASRPATEPSGTVPPEVSTGDCSNCGAARVGGERFCEVCGLDFETGRLPAAPQPAPAPAVPTGPVGSPAPEAPGIGWTAIVACDHDWWEHNSGAGGVASGVPYPDPEPPPRPISVRSRNALIGRTSGSSVADIDCGGADTGVSRKHARITLRDDGTWGVTDLGSTNGTFVGPDSTRLTPQAETALAPGDAIKIGAYTVIVLEADATPAS